MKRVILLLSAAAACLSASAQNCSHNSVGYPPINDLGTGTWRGAMGGRYPGGSNSRPAVHDAAGLYIAQHIQPLNNSGAVDTANGKIVWLSVGMSNTTQESQVFIPQADTLSNKNEKLVLIDGAQGGKDINIIVHDTADFWRTIYIRLQQAGLTPAQVQAIWFKEAEKQPTDTAFATYPDGLLPRFKTTMQVLKQKFPNARLCYLSSRIYGGYATTPENPEPYAYYTGWTVKRLIEAQISGDTALIFSGSNARAPWLSWGPYPWADGATPRSDGLSWRCPTDFVNDGTHPSPIGRQKVADMLMKFFTTDATTTPWFLKQQSSSTGVAGVQTGGKGLQLYPQPAAGKLTIVFRDNAERPATVTITDLSGRAMQQVATDGKSLFTIDISCLAPGMYMLSAGTQRGHFVKQ